MSLPLFAEALIRELALEAEKRVGPERSAIEALTGEIRTLGETLNQLARKELREMDLVHVLSRIKAGFDDEQVLAATRHAQETCASFFSAARQKRAPDPDLLLNQLVTDIESVMLSLVHAVTKSF